MPWRDGAEVKPFYKKADVALDLRRVRTRLSFPFKGFDQYVSSIICDALVRNGRNIRFVRLRNDSEKKKRKSCSLLMRGIVKAPMSQTSKRRARVRNNG